MGRDRISPSSYTSLLISPYGFPNTCRPPSPLVFFPRHLSFLKILHDLSYKSSFFAIFLLFRAVPAAVYVAITAAVAIKTYPPCRYSTIFVHRLRLTCVRQLSCLLRRFCPCGDAVRCQIGERETARKKKNGQWRSRETDEARGDGTWSTYLPFSRLRNDLFPWICRCRGMPDARCQIP